MLKGRSIAKGCLAAGAAVGIGVGGAELGEASWKANIAIRERQGADGFVINHMQDFPLWPARLGGALLFETIVVVAATAGKALEAGLGPRPSS